MNLVATVIELRRRRVFRGAGLYIVGVFLMLQVADIVVEPLGLPPRKLSHALS